MGAYCGPEPKTSKYADAYDKRYWQQVDIERDGIISGCKLVLKSGVLPSTAIAALVDEQDRWGVDCAGFVQVAHWYAMYHVVGPANFNAAVERPFELQLEKERGRTAGLKTVKTYKAHRPGENMEVWIVRDDGQLVLNTDLGKHSPQQALRDAPVGSRVMWSNIMFLEQPRLGDQRVANAREYENENSVKLGDDKYGAFPLFHDARTVLTADEIVQQMAEVAASAYDVDVDAVRQEIFVSEIEIVEPGAGLRKLP